jgi:hypothetical protein
MFFHSLLEALFIIIFSCLVAILFLFGGEIYQGRYLLNKSYERGFSRFAFGFILFIVSEVCFSSPSSGLLSQ